MFKKGDIVIVAKEEYLDKGETFKDTIQVVIDHNPDNDYLVLGVLNPQDYALAPQFSTRGCYYRQLKKDEYRKWGICANG